MEPGAFSEPASSIRVGKMGHSLREHCSWFLSQSSSQILACSKASTDVTSVIGGRLLIPSRGEESLEKTELVPVPSFRGQLNSQRTSVQEYFKAWAW